MEVKANVQKRRQDRIKQLLSRNAEEGRGAGADLAGPDERRRRTALQERPGAEPALPEQERPAEPPLYIRGRLDREDHGGDPEAAWKNRQRQLLEWYSSGGAMEESPPGERPSMGQAGSGSRSGGRGPFRKLFKAKLAVSAVLFIIACVVFRLDTSWSREAKGHISAALTKDMDFSKAAAWYDKTFSGSPSFLPAFGSKQEAAKVQGRLDKSRFVQPVKGKVTEAFSNKLEGIRITTRPDAQAAAMDQGRIEFAGDKTTTGHTVIIRHADGYRTTYGNLKPTAWEEGDWVKAGELLGPVANGEDGNGVLYLAVMKDERYIDPLDVVSVD